LKNLKVFVPKSGRSFCPNAERTKGIITLFPAAAITQTLAK